MRQGARPVAYSPGLLDATAHEMEGGRILSVYRSVRVRDTDRVYWPVITEIAGRCATLKPSEWFEDTSMMGSEAEALDIKVWDVCPGSEVTHHCLAVVPRQKEGEEDSAQVELAAQAV